MHVTQTIVAAVGGHPTATDALGLLSLVIWALIVTISIKYCVFVMRADNHGEGGILALMALVTGRTNHGGRGTAVRKVTGGLFGAALIYGDGIAIPPAISVLSALEGINAATDSRWKPCVFAPASLLAILLGLFAVQPRGTASVGACSDPSCCYWFITGNSRTAGRSQAAAGRIAAIDPRHAVGFVAEHRLHSFVVLGGVFTTSLAENFLCRYGSRWSQPDPLIVKCWIVHLRENLLSYAGQTALLVEIPSLQKAIHSLSWRQVGLSSLSSRSPLLPRSSRARLSYHWERSR